MVYLNLLKEAWIVFLGAPFIFTALIIVNDRRVPWPDIPPIAEVWRWVVFKIIFAVFGHIGLAKLFLTVLSPVAAAAVSFILVALIILVYPMLSDD